MLNRWRLFGFVVAAVDHTFRTVGIAAFAALVIVSVVLPLLVINVINGRDAGDIAAIRASAAQLFPEMFTDNGPSGEDDTQETSAASVRPLVADQRAMNAPSDGLSNGRERLRWCMTMLLCVAAANVALLIARVYLRFRADSHVAGSSMRFTFEGGIASAVVVMALAAAAAAWMYRGGNLMAEAGVVHESISWYRAPASPERMRTMLPQKFVAEVLFPERTFDTVWYVDAKAVGTARDGRTWDTAFADIADAVTAAAQNGGGEIWVARGIYPLHEQTLKIWSPDYLVVSPAPDNRIGSFLVSLPEHRNRTTLIIPHRVHVYGGFAGATSGGYEQSRMERNWVTNPVVVCGRSGGVIAGFGDWTLDGVHVFGYKVVSLDRTLAATAR